MSFCPWLIFTLTIHKGDVNLAIVHWWISITWSPFMHAFSCAKPWFTLKPWKRQMGTYNIGINWPRAEWWEVICCFECSIEFAWWILAYFSWRICMRILHINELLRICWVQMFWPLRQKRLSLLSHNMNHFRRQTTRNYSLTDTIYQTVFLFIIFPLNQNVSNSGWFP